MQHCIERCQTHRDELGGIRAVVRVDQVDCTQSGIRLALELSEDGGSCSVVGVELDLTGAVNQEVTVAKLECSNVAVS